MRFVNKEKWLILPLFLYVKKRLQMKKNVI